MASFLWGAIRLPNIGGHYFSLAVDIVKDIALNTILNFGILNELRLCVGHCFGRCSCVLY